MIGRLTAIARPYALAAFEYAEEKKDLSGWQTFLSVAAEVAENSQVKQILSDPEIPASQVKKLFSEVLEKLLDKEKINFIELLAEKARLNVLPEIAQIFKEYKDQYEKIVSVKITTAVPLEPSLKEKMETALTRRLKQKVALESEVDPAVIGGAIIKTAEDVVIDDSVKGKLDRLLNLLSA